MSRDVPQIFDRRALRANRRRAAAGLPAHDFLLRRAADELADRLQVHNRRFRRAVCLGASGGLLRAEAEARGLVGPAASGGKIDAWLDADLSAALLPQGGLVLDEENLPLKPKSCDLIISFWGLHHVNDLPGALIQICRALTPDGLFLAALPGNDNLRALQSAFLAAETELLGGVRPHIHPFADLRDLAGLMQRAGFALPVADSLPVPVRYGDPLRLLADLRGMGESNVLAARHKAPLRRDVLASALARFTAATQQDGKAVADFEICYLAGFAPGGAAAKHEPGTPITRFDDSFVGDPS